MSNTTIAFVHLLTLSENFTRIQMTIYENNKYTFNLFDNKNIDYYYCV